MRTESRHWLSDDVASDKLVIVDALLDQTAEILEEVDRVAPPELQAQIGKAFRNVLIALEELPR